MVKNDYCAPAWKAKFSQGIGKPGELEGCEQDSAEPVVLIDNGIAKIKDRFLGARAVLEFSNRKVPCLHHALKEGLVAETLLWSAGFSVAKKNAIGFDQPEIQVIGIQPPEIYEVGFAKRPVSGQDEELQFIQGAQKLAGGPDVMLLVARSEAGKRDCLLARGAFFGLAELEVSEYGQDEDRQHDEKE